MGTMGATTEITAFAGYAVSRICRFSNGTRVIAVNGTGSGTTVYTSTDGVTWTQLATYSTATQNAGTPDLFVDQDDNLHLIVCANGTVYVFSSLLNAPGINPVTGARSVQSITFQQNVSTASPPRIFAHRITPGNTTDGWTVHWFYMYQVQRQNGTIYYNPQHTWRDVKGTGFNNGAGAYPLNGNPGQNWWDSVTGFTAEMQHIGDGKTPPPNGPRMFFAVHGTPGGANRQSVCISAGAFTAGSQTSGTWAWTTGTDSSGSTVGYQGIDMLWSGSGGLLALTYSLGDGAGYTTYYSAVNSFDANGATAGTVWSANYYNKNATGSVNTLKDGISIAVDSSGIAYAFGVPVTATDQLQFMSLNPVTVISKISPPANVQHNGAYLRRQGTFGGIDLSWLRYYTQQGQYRTATAFYTTNAAPNVGGKPSPDGTTIDRASANTFSYAFSDPDLNDQPSRTDWRWRTSPSSGTPGAWNTSTVSGTSTSITYPAGTFPAGRIEVQDFPYDSQGVAAPGWSDSAFVTAADAPTAVTFVSPAAGSTIPSSSVTTTISTPQLDALGWEVRDATSNALLASGTIEDSTARAFTATGLANGSTVRVRARRRVSGLWSPWADNGTQPVSFTPPPLPAITLTYDSTRGSATEGTMLISWAIPAPTGSEPTVTAIDISLDHGDLDGMHRVAAALTPGTGTGGALAGSWRYWSPVHQRDYGSGSGRVRLTATGSNGTTRTATS